MKLLDKYIARQFFLTYVFASISFTSLFVLVNLIEKLDRFLDKGVETGQIVLYYLNLTPETLVLTSPLSTLLASFYVTGRMSGSSELSAMKSAGAGLRDLLKPFFAVAFLISLFNILDAGWFAPKTTALKNRFEMENFGKYFDTINKGIAENDNLHVLESQNRILSIGRLDPHTTTGYTVSLETFDGASVVRRIDAKEISYNPSLDRWILHDTTTRVFRDGVLVYSSNPGTDTLKLSLSASSLNDLSIQPNEMTIFQQHRYIREKQEAGFSNLGSIVVNFHNKLSLPFAPLLMILIGVPLSSRQKRSGLAFEFGISLFIGLLYLGFQKTVTTAGYMEQFNPVLASWLPNLLFLVVGIIIYKIADT